MSFLIERLECGASDLVSYGSAKGTKTPSILTVMPCNASGKILFLVLRTMLGLVVINLMMYIAAILLEYYHELFTSSRPNLSTSVLEQIPHVITDDMNSPLSNTFLESEVTMDLRQMAPLKAPRPDGMPLLFYQHIWLTVSGDVT